MKNVYLTALTNERYIPGVMALARALNAVGSKYELAVMIPADKEAGLGSAIRAYGILNIPGVFLLPMENIALEDNSHMDRIVEAKYSYWRDTFFKLQALGCTAFEKVILLDSDMLIQRNIDHLFEAPAFTATTCGRCVRPEWNNFNSGLLVIEPDMELYGKAMSLIVPAIEMKAARGMQAGDQDVFQMTFPEWNQHPELYIPECYNVGWGWIYDLCKKEGYSPEDLYIVHFTGKKKPWDFDKGFYLKQAAALLLHGKVAEAGIRTRIWRKYRDLCDPM